MVKIPRSKGILCKNAVRAWDSSPRAAEIGNPRSDQERETIYQRGGSSLPTPAWTSIVFAVKEKTVPGFLSAVPKDAISKGRKEKAGQGVTVCFLVWALEYL